MVYLLKMVIVHGYSGYLGHETLLRQPSSVDPIWMSLRAAELAGHDQRNVTGQPLEINVEKVGEHVDLYRL